MFLMKWYIEYLMVWVIVFLAYLTWFTSDIMEFQIRIIVSLMMGTFISAAGYAGYYEVKKKQKMQKASEKERAIMQENAHKTNRVMNLIIINPQIGL